MYRGDAIVSLRGWYVFGDYCSGKVWALSVTNDSSQLLTLGDTGNVSAICDGPDGELYVLAYKVGSLLRIDAA